MVITDQTPVSPFWLKFLPALLRTRIERQPNLLKVLTNTGWLISDRVLRMGVGLLVGVWVARYLGPAQFGLLSFALAFVALFGAIATLGLHGIVVRDIVRDPSQAQETLGTSFILRLVGGLVTFGLLIGVISYLRPDDTLARTIVAILAFTLVFKASEGVKYWFESQVQSKYTVWAETSVFLTIAAIKVGMILSQAPLIAFVWATFAEALVVAAALLIVYAWRGGRLTALQATVRRGTTLLKDGWPLILSGLAIMIYMRIDQIMLGQMVNDEAVGIYTAAVRISEVWYFVPTAIVASLFPSIIQAKDRSESSYRGRIQKLYDLMVVLALLVAIPVTLFSHSIVTTLFGSAYQTAGTVLSIHVWAAVFVFLGVSSSRWLLAENLQKYSLYRTAIGCVTNIFLNLLLIPQYGPVGAALATVVSYFISVFSLVLFSTTREASAMMLLSFNFFRHIKALDRATR